MNGLVLSIRLSFLFAFLLPCRLPAAETATAADVLERTGIRGGLVVVLGCEDPDLIADLRAGDSFLVRGLDTDLAKMEQARKAIQARGLYGPVSVDRFEGDKLPFVDNLVNLMVVSDSSRQVSDEELMRVVAPGGVLCTFSHSPLTIRHSVKPRPAEIDDWTHWLHGPDNNAVSRDRQVGVSSSLQWIMPPLWGRHHNLLHVINAMVSANGRVFVIIDEAPIAVRGLTDRWVLLCRDAFNGLDLWRRPLADWGWRKWSPLEVGIEMRYQSPEQLLNRLVAVDDVVYVTLGFEAPVTALDARTGQTLRTYAGTERTATISFREGTLYLTRNAAGDKKQVVATSTARQRALRSLPIVTRNCRCGDDTDKEAGSRVEH